MDLHRRKGHGLQRIQNGDAGVGIGGGVDDDAVEYPVSSLDRVHDGPLVVGLETLDLHPGLLRACLQEVQQGGIVLLPVDLRFPQAQQIQIGPVDDEQLHPITSRICRSDSSGVPLLSISPSEKKRYKGSRCRYMSARSPL